MRKEAIEIREARSASVGTGAVERSKRDRDHASFGACTIAIAIMSITLLTGCSPDMKDGLGPRVPVSNVDGEVRRQGTPAARLSVSVRNPLDSHSVASTHTGTDGAYAIAAPAGAWEIRVSGGATGDFESVTREFNIADSEERLTIPDIDIFAWGANMVSPTDSTEIELSSPGDSISFVWALPSMPVRSARVQIYDAGGAAVWYSDKTPGTSVSWNGAGNQGVFMGHTASPGSYRWRVKYQFADSSEARLPYRSLVIR